MFTCNCYFLVGHSIRQGNFLKDNAAENPLYQAYWNGDGTLTADALDNTALYGDRYTDDALVQHIANTAGEYFKGEIETLKGKIDEKLCDTTFGQDIADGVKLEFDNHFNAMTPENDAAGKNGVESTLEEIISLASSLGVDDANIDISMLKDLDGGIKNYVYAAICDAVQGNAHNWRSQYYTAMREGNGSANNKGVDGLINDQLEAKLVNADIGKQLTDLAKLKSIDSISKLTIEELITTLDNVSSLASSSGSGVVGPQVESLVEKYGKSIINYIQKGANAIKDRNVKVTVTFNGETDKTQFTLDNDDLNILATSTAEKLANFLKAADAKLVNITLAEFKSESFCTITVESGANKVTVVPVIAIPAIIPAQ